MKAYRYVQAARADVAAVQWVAAETAVRDHGGAIGTTPVLRWVRLLRPEERDGADVVTSFDFPIWGFFMGYFGRNSRRWITPPEIFVATSCRDARATVLHELRHAEQEYRGWNEWMTRDQRELDAEFAESTPTGRPLVAVRPRTGRAHQPTGQTAQPGGDGFAPYWWADGQRQRCTSCAA